MGAFTFKILGQLEVENGLVPVRGGREQAVLAVLLLEAGHVMPLAKLVEAVWDSDPPQAAEKAVRNTVSALRSRLAPAAGSQALIETSTAGYRLRLDRSQLDAALFADHVASARHLAGTRRAGEAVAEFRAALGLWRGPALAGLGGRVIEAAAARLDEQRLTAWEDCLDLELRLGRHREVTDELRALADEHPLRERLAGQLMLALYRAGRQADALDAYHRLAKQLADELGLDASGEITRLHEAILRQDPVLNPAVKSGETDRAADADPAGAAPRRGLSTGGEPAGRSGWRSPVLAADLYVPLPEPPPDGLRLEVPRELPASVHDFIGRGEELEMLAGLLKDSGKKTPGTVVISAIGGTAGVGKTALALHFAHQIAGQFGDGQLYVNLRGFDPSGVPMTPAEAVRTFLDGLGVPPERVPAQLDAQAGLYRSLLGERKMLIVLDNARDEQQVRPLLPASPASLVIVTSRNQLAGLAVADGARLVGLDILTHNEAVQLLTARIGASRAAAEPEAIDEITSLCAYLPLALAVTAARAATRPRFPISQLAAELRDATNRLDALDADPAVSVGAVFSWSYRQLNPEAARMFRLLGLHPGPDISIPAAASLAGKKQADARRLLRELARDYLITEHVPGRYGFHDLLRAYAASKARECDPEPDRDAATSRILDHYLHTASHNATLLQPTREPVTLAPPHAGTRPEQLADHRQAMAWYEAEHQVLLAAVTFAAETGADNHAWQLPWAMSEYLHRRGYPHEHLTIMGIALAAATRTDDSLGQARSLRGLGIACASTGNFDQARAHLERCPPLYQRLNDRMGEGLAQQNLSALALTQGRHADALDHSRQALHLFQAIGHKAGEALALSNIAWSHAVLGGYQQARAFCKQSLALIAKLDSCHFEHDVWETLGYIEHHLGDFARAAEHFDFALGLCRDHGHRFTEASILSHAGDARHAAGELAQAREAWQQALAIYDDIQHPDAAEVRAKLASMGGRDE